MKLIIRHNNAEWRKPIETEVQRHVLKLQRLLKSFNPDLVQLHGDVEKLPRKETYFFSVSLALPTGILHATGEGSQLRTSVKTAFAEIEAQIKKHMALLRKDYQWRRKRPNTGALA